MDRKKEMQIYERNNIFLKLILGMSPTQKENTLSELFFPCFPGEVYGQSTIPEVPAA
jgi:hypothetical protein